MSILSSDARRSRGLTLVEVMVTFTIVGVAIVIFVPQLLHARDKARSSSCQAKLRNLSLGVLSFESAQGALPAGAYVNDRQFRKGRCPDIGRASAGFGTTQVVNRCFDIFGAAGAPNYSWIVNILPHIGEQGVFNQIDFSLTAQAHFAQPIVGSPQLPPDETVVFAREIRSLICPTDGGPKAHYNGDGAITFGQFGVAKSGGFAKGNYVGYASAVHIDHFTDRQGALGGFDVGDLAGQTISQISDGAANTLMLTEVRTTNFEFDSRGVWSLAFPGATLVCVDHHSVNPADPQYVPDPNYDPQNMALPNTQDFHDIVVGVMSKHVPQLEQLGVPARGFNQGGAFVAAAARSLHPGGVHASSVDGHVGLICNEIDPLVYTYLVYTRDGQLTPVNTHVK